MNLCGERVIEIVLGFNGRKGLSQRRRRGDAKRQRRIGRQDAMVEVLQPRKRLEASR
jgi:hypothetical protein